MAEVVQNPLREAHTGQAPTRFRWTRKRYEQMIEAGILQEDDRVELLEGEIVEMSPQKSLHATAVTKLLLRMLAVYEEGFVVRPQLPLAFDPDSEPEPDLAVIKGKVEDFREAHPSSALLIVEVADATLATDRTVKARLYARHGISEYWILNVADECLEVHRAPNTSGETYQTKVTLHAGDTITPPEASTTVHVDDLLP